MERVSSRLPTVTSGLTREDFEGDRYIRLRRLRTLLEDGSLAADLRWVRAAV